jgi:hypothetical protein
MHTSTHLIALLQPDNEEHALYLLSEILFPGSSTVIDRREETRVSTIAEPFTICYKQMCLTLALSAALTPEQIKEIAELVTTGLLSGFIVQGEIDLGGQIINNLGNFEDQHESPIERTRNHSP